MDVPNPAREFESELLALLKRHGLRLERDVKYSTKRDSPVEREILNQPHTAVTVTLMIAARSSTAPASP